MRKNDYHVVAYSILSYLYDCLKQGEEVRDDFIRLEWYPVKLPTSYRWFIYNGLSEMGYIDTIGWDSSGGWKYGDFCPPGSCIEITGKGIEYLHTNDLMVGIARGFYGEGENAFAKINKNWQHGLITC